MPATRDGNALGAKVRAARLSRGISLRGLASIVQVSPATLSQIENGRTGLSAHRLGQIADALDMTVSQVMDFTAAFSAEPIDARARRPATRAPGTIEALGSTRTAWREYGPLTFDPVLGAALDEFLAIGYHGATVRGIAARCGMSVSGIYHYYTSKHQMLVSLLELTMNELLARSDAARAEGRDPVERFSLLIEHVALFHTHRRELGFLGASEMRSLDDHNRRKIANMRNTQQHMIDHEVADAVRVGRFRTPHPHEAARAAVTMCTALSTWWRPDGPLSAEQIAQRYVEIALDLVRLNEAP